MGGTNISMELVNDGNDDCPEGDDESHENDSVVMLCYDWSTGSINSAYNNQADCLAGGSTLQWIDMESAIMGMMFNMYDNNSDGFINASELDMMIEMGDDDHDGHDESHDCVNVPAGAVAPEDGTFTFAIGTTVHVETGDTAPAAGVYCAESHEDHHEEHGVRGFANLHVEAEGEYGFLLPAGVA